MGLRLSHSHRLNIIGAWLHGLLKRFDPPEKMDNDALREELAYIGEDVNSNIAASVNEGELKLVLDAAHRKLRRRMFTRKWPTIKQFIDAIEDSAIKTDAIAPEDRREKEHYIAKKIKAGESIPEAYLYGHACLDLLGKTDITIDQLEPYRKQFFNTIAITYGQEVANKIQHERETAHQTTIENQ